MKPKLTTSGAELIKQVKLELTAPFSDQCRLLFAVFPALGIGHSSVQLIDSEIPFLISREWKPELQGTYPTGIYDLHAIYIAEKRIALSPEDQIFIRKIKHLDLNVQRSAAIMLDGAAYTFQMDDKTIHWTLIDTISPEFENALERLTGLAGFEYSRRRLQ